MLLLYRDELGRGGLHLAAAGGKVGAVRRLLRAGVTLAISLILLPLTQLMDATKILTYLGNTLAVFLMVIAPAFIAQQVLLDDGLIPAWIIYAFYGYSCMGLLGFCLFLIV